MRKKAESTKPSSIPNLILSVLLGTGVALLLFFLSALLVAALIWGGALSASKPGVFLTVCAALCAFVGSRTAIGKGSGQAMLTGAVTAAALCVVLILICFAAAGEIAFPVQLRAVLLSALAGGCFAGLLGGKKRRKKKKKK